MMMLHHGGAVRRMAAYPFFGEIAAGSVIDRFLERGARPEDLFLEKTRILKTSPSTRTGVVTLKGYASCDEEERLFVKEYFIKNVLHSLKPLFVAHRAPKVWALSRSLIERSVAPVPRPLGYLIKRIGIFSVKGYFFCEAISNCCSLGELAGNSEEIDGRLFEDDFMEMIARNIASLHAAGVLHGDLKWSNILIDKGMDQMWLVDLDAARVFGKPLGPAFAARDLARFLLNAAEAAPASPIAQHFLGCYARTRDVDLARFEKSTKRILLKLARRHRRKYGEGLQNAAGQNP